MFLLHQVAVQLPQQNTELGCHSKNVDCASNKLSLASKGSTERNYDKTACFTDPQWLRLLKAWDILQIKRCDVVS